MTVLNQGLNAARVLLREAVATVEIGTGTTTETTVDTALETQVASKTASVYNGGTGVFTARGRLGAADNNGSDLTEVGIKDSSTLWTRKTHAVLEKTSLIEVEYEIKVTVRNAT